MVFNFSASTAGFSPSVKVNGECRNGHSLTCSATPAEFRAGNMMVFCPCCDAWVLPVWEFMRRNSPAPAEAEPESLELVHHQFSAPGDWEFTPETE